MNLLHLSEIYNRRSIESNGLRPSKIRLEEHLKSFQEDKIISGNEALYTWEDSLYNEKFITDMIYCKVWIHPRDAFISDDPVDLRYVTDKPLYKHSQMLFDVYKAEVPEKDCDYFHLQVPSEDVYNTTFRLDDKFAHDNKRLHIFEHPLRAERIGQACYYYDNGKINIKIIY
jgi:hypothetical protein